MPASGDGVMVRADRDQAVGLLVSYFKALTEHAGLTWTPDETAEIAEAVDRLIAAAVDVAARAKAEGALPVTS